MKQKTLRSFRQGLVVFSLGAILTLCACSSITNHPYDPNDPLQTVNRATFAFNQQFDRYVLKPTAEVYQAIVPAPARQGVNNFFMNLNQIPTTINYVLQGSPGPAYESLWRFLINSTVGIGGLFDVASHMGLERTTNDFGITLSKWGFSSSPYLVLPFLGPSNIRDGLASLVNYEFFTVWPYMDKVALRNSLLGLDVIRVRANLLESSDILDSAALDKYSLTRDAYLQYRYQLINAHGGSYTQGAQYVIDEQSLMEDLGTEDLPLKEMVQKESLPEKGNKAARTDAINRTVQKTASQANSADKDQPSGSLAK